MQQRTDWPCIPKMRNGRIKGDDSAVWGDAVCAGEMNLLKDSQTGIPQQSDGLAIEVVLEVYLL